jgi:hypothetical protein
MSFSFPLSPIINQTYSYGGTTWVYNGSAWGVQSNSAGSIFSADGTSIINTNNVLSASSSNIKSVAAGLLTSGTSTGITFSYNSGTGLLTSTVTGTQQQAGISGVTVQSTGVTQGSASAVTTLNFTGTYTMNGQNNIVIDSNSKSKDDLKKTQKMPPIIIDVEVVREYPKIRDGGDRFVKLIAGKIEKAY